MALQRLFDQILASLHEAMLDEAHWLPTSALIDEALGSKGNHLVFSEPPWNDGIDVLFMRFCYRGEHHRELERRYFDTYYPVDDHLPGLRALAHGEIAHVRETFRGQALATSVMYNEAMPLYGFQNGLNVRMDGPHGSQIVFGIADPIDAADWSSAQIDLLRRLLPHIRQFVRMRHALADARAVRATVAGLLESTGVGVIHLDRRGRVAAVNDRALAVLRKRDGLCDEDGRLRAALACEDETLQGLVERAVPYPGGTGAGGSMTLTRERAVSRLQVHVSPVRVDGTDTSRSGRIGALVLVIDPAERLKLDPEALGAHPGLTLAQSHVAASLVEGKSARDIAAETGRKVTTIKWHIRQIFGKHRMSGQADLVRLAMSLADVPGMRRRRGRR